MDDVRTDLYSDQRWCSVWPCSAYEDLEVALGPDVDTWRYDELHTATHQHAMTDVPVLGDWLNVGPYGLPAAKDALCKYEFKLKRDVDYSIFSGPSKRIGIDFADVDGAESILPTGQSGNVFSPFYDNQAPLYHSGQFRKMRMDRADIEAHTTAVASSARKRTADAHNASVVPFPRGVHSELTTMMRPSSNALLLALTLSTSLHAQEAGRSERYIESNWGIAIINPNSGAIFPGTCFG